MTRIVCVHGVGQHMSSAGEQLNSWLPALRRGLAAAGAAGAAPADEEVAAAFYGDLFLRVPGVEPCYSTADLHTGLETELLMAWWRHAAGNEPQVSGPDQGPAADWLKSALYALAGSRWCGELSGSALIFAVKQLRRYVTEPDLRAAVRARVAACVSDDTRVVVAHSLGAVAAYETLARMPDHKVRAFVTVGSPLAVRPFVFDRLEPRPLGGAGVWPGRSDMVWTDVTDRTDALALGTSAGVRFTEPVTVHQVDVGPTVRDPSAYLTCAAVAAAVAAGLGD